jgi:hypothetical protein
LKKESAINAQKPKSEDAERIMEYTKFISKVASKSEKTSLFNPGGHYLKTASFING